MRMSAMPGIPSPFIRQRSRLPLHDRLSRTLMTEAFTPHIILPSNTVMHHTQCHQCQRSARMKRP